MSKIRWLGLVIFIVSLAIRLFELNRAGNVWDEYFYYDAVRGYARNLVQLDSQADHWGQNLEHPPLGKYVYAPALMWNKAFKVADRDAYHSLRVMAAIIGSLTVGVIYLIGVRFFSRRVGWVAAMIYGLLPPVLAYHRMVNLDVTMVFLSTVSLYFFVDWLKHRLAKSLWWAVFFSSLAIATKFNAALILAVFYGVFLIERWRSIRRDGLVELPLPLALAPFVSLLWLIMLWPWLWGDTLDHLLKTLIHWGGAVSEQFWGRWGPAPIHYFVSHFIVGTPVLILGLLVIGGWRVVKAKQLIGWTLITWFLAPFLISFYHLRQDHLRYVLAAFPAVALIAALGFWWLVDVIFKKQVWLKVGSALAFSFYLLVISWWIHPYYLNYYNELVGGPKGVATQNLFDLGFYGEGIKEATEFVNQTAANGAIVHYEIIPDDAPYLDRPRLGRFDAKRDANHGFDFLIVNANALKDEKKRSVVESHTSRMQLAYTVKANGAAFVWVYKNSKIKMQNAK